MSDREKCTPPVEDPRVSVFREVALLQVPAPWRSALRHLGEQLFEVSLEQFGVAGELPDSLATTACRLEALASDIDISRAILEGLSTEPQASTLGAAETGLCRSAGAAVPVLQGVVSTLRSQP